MYLYSHGDTETASADIQVYWWLTYRENRAVLVALFIHGPPSIEQYSMIAMLNILTRQPRCIFWPNNGILLTAMSVNQDEHLFYLLRTRLKAKAHLNLARSKIGSSTDRLSIPREDTVSADVCGTCGS